MLSQLKSLGRRSLIKGGKIASIAARQRSWRRSGIRPPTTRQAFLADIPGDVLEIGPFDNPSLRGERITYFDVLDQAALIARAREHGRNPDTCPRIDYVSPTGDLSIVDRTFSSVFSSHAIEHQPDLVTHLRGVEKLLQPGGRYYLAVPDKRYCFDYYHAASTIGEVERALAEARRVHTPANVLMHRLGITHNDALRHWLGLHGRQGHYNVMVEEAEADARRAQAGDYVDVHAWIFTPASFLDIATDLFGRGSIALKPVMVHDTTFSDLEFFAILERAR